MQNKQSLIIGITGGIGSGKSLACEYFQKLGCKIFYADEIAKNLYFSDKKLRAALVKQFGKNILDNKGLINFPEFRKIVFKSDANQKRVNKIVHPFVISEILAQAKKSKSKIVIVEAALIFESGFEKYNDYTILIYSNTANRTERVQKRSKLSKVLIKSIMKLQMPENEKKKKADIIIENDGTKRELQKKVKFVFGVLKALSK
jgi:dephospho-CoA kinase